MRKWPLIFFLPIGLHLFQLFFLHYDGKIKPQFFEHGFQSSYSQQVEGLDDSCLDTILQQPFYWLGQGKQMVAFLSQDQKYVLKLFNPMRPLDKNWQKQGKYWRRYTSLKWLKREWLGKKNRLTKLFKRHKLAYELLKEETGLVFVHLKHSKRICHCITLIDQEGKQIPIHLANTPFVLQKKADLVPVHLNHLLQENRFEEAKEGIVLIQKLLEKRIQLGITDRIQTMENNYGFVDGKPIQIDVGRIRWNKELDKAAEKERILCNFQAWVSAKYAALLLR